MKKFSIFFLGIIVLIVGICTLFLGKAKSERCTAKANGTVIEVIEEVTENDGTTEYQYRPVIEYKVGDNTITNQSDSYTSDRSKYNENDKVDILYNPDNIEEFIINDGSNSNISSIIFIVVGAIIAVIGIIKAFIFK